MNNFANQRASQSKVHIRLLFAKFLSRYHWGKVIKEVSIHNRISSAKIDEQQYVSIIYKKWLEKVELCERNFRLNERRETKPSIRRKTKDSTKNKEKFFVSVGESSERVKSLIKLNWFVKSRGTKILFTSRSNICTKIQRTSIDKVIFYLQYFPKTITYLESALNSE